MTTEFFSAIKRGEREDVQRLLRGTPGLIHEKENGLSPVLVAVYHDQPELANMLADRTVGLSVFEAAATGRTNHVIRLLAKGPELVNAYSEDGYQPLGLACFFGHQGTAAYLIKAGASVNSPSRNSMNVTPLHSAAAGRHLPIVRMLLEHGADPNAREQGDFTPLHAAAQNGDTEIIRALLFHGGDADARTADGRTPLDLAEQAGHSEAARLLKEGITKRLRKR